MTVGRSLLRQIGVLLGAPEAGAPAAGDTQADYVLAPPGRRACTVEDLRVGRHQFTRGPAWYWTCRNCPTGGGTVFAATVVDGVPRARRDAWDLARAHLAGQTVCRPRVVQAAPHHVAAGAAWAWSCSRHSEFALGPRGFIPFPTHAAAYDDARAHAVGRDRGAA